MSTKLSGFASPTIISRAFACQPHVHDSPLLLQDHQPLHMGWHWISDKLQSGTYIFPQFPISLHHLYGFWVVYGSSRGHKGSSPGHLHANLMSMIAHCSFKIINHYIWAGLVDCNFLYEMPQNLTIT